MAEAEIFNIISLKEAVENILVSSLSRQVRHHSTNCM
jgi:hypothetical protein